jgi:hypothetical protein
MMMMIIDRVVTMIGLLDFWDNSRGEVETYSIWQDRSSFSIPKIEAGSGFAELDFTETPFQGMIQDNGFSPFSDFSLGFPREEDADWAHWSNSDDQSGTTSAWWFLSRISLGPWL